MSADLLARIEALETRIAALENGPKLGAPALGKVLSSDRTLPLLDTGWRPRFWRDREVAEFLTALHRRVELQRALDLVAEAFGADRVPSKSALNRYWVKLDALVRRAA